MHGDPYLNLTLSTTQESIDLSEMPVEELAALQANVVKVSQPSVFRVAKADPFSLLQAYSDTFLSTSGRATSLHALVDLMRHAIVVGRKQTGPRSFSWNGTFDQLTDDLTGKSLTVSGAKAFIHKAIEEATTQYRKLLQTIPGTSPEGINLVNLAEERNSISLDLNFVTVNPALKKISLLQRAGSHFFLSPDSPSETKPKLDEERATAFLVKAAAFTHTLAVAIAVGSGFSARHFELLDILASNAPTRKRSIFILDDGEVLLVTQASKNSWRKEHAPAIGRLLPPAVARLLVSWLAEAFPLVQAIQCALGNAVNRAVLLSASGTEQMESREFISSWRRIQAKLGSNVVMSFDPNMWRHYMVAVSRRRAPLFASQLEDFKEDAQILFDGLDDAADEDAFDDTVVAGIAAQFNHSKAVSAAHYARLSSDQDGFDWASLPAIIHLGFAVQIYFGLREPAKQTFTSAEKRKEPDSSTVKQAQAPKILKQTLDPLYTLAFPQHNPVAIYYASPPPPSATPYLRSPLPSSVIQAYHKVIGKVASIQSADLANALSAAVRPTLATLLVLPTGGGKTTTYQVAATLLPPAQIIIIVIPYLALLDDAFQRSASLPHLPSRIWLSKSDKISPTETKLVFVSYDRFVGDDFGVFLRKAVQQKWVNSIFFDESHVLLTEQLFRRKMSDAARLTEHGIPLILLSATLPPSWEKELKERLNVPVLSIVRAPTHRPNLSMKVLVASREDEIWSKAHSLIRNCAGACLIVCRTVQMVGAVWTKLNAAFPTRRVASYTSANKTTETNVIAAFVKGELDILVGTSVVGTGIHHPHIRLVIAYNTPYSLAQLQQLYGRAGRDGQPAQAVCISYSGFDDAGLDHMEMKALWDHLGNLQCRRTSLASFFDGLAAQCLEIAGDLCDVCSKKYKLTLPSAPAGPTANSTTAMVQASKPVPATPSGKTPMRPPSTQSASKSTFSARSTSFYSAVGSTSPLRTPASFSRTNYTTATSPLTAPPSSGESVSFEGVFHPLTVSAPHSELDAASLGRQQEGGFAGQTRTACRRVVLLLLCTEATLPPLPALLQTRLRARYNPEALSKKLQLGR